MGICWRLGGLEGEKWHWHSSKQASFRFREERHRFMWPRDTQKQGPRGKPAPPEWMDLYYSGGVGPGVPLGHRRETAENSDRVQLRSNNTRAWKFPKK